MKKKLISLILVIFILVSLLTAIPIFVAAAYENTYNQDFTALTTIADAITSLDTFWNVGTNVSLTGGNVAWDKQTGLTTSGQWFNYCQTSTKKPMENYKFTANIKAASVNAQWVGVAIRENITKSNLPNENYQNGKVLGQSTHGIMFTIVGSVASNTSSMTIAIRTNQSGIDKDKVFTVPLSSAGYFSNQYRNIIIEDKGNEITFKAGVSTNSPTLLAKIVIDTTKTNADGSYNTGEVFDGTGLSKGTFSAADNVRIPQKGMVSLVQRNNMMIIKSLKMEEVLSIYEAQAKNYTTQSGTTIDQNGNVESFDADDYICFSGINFTTSMKTIEVYGSSRMDVHKDADIFQVRIDSLNGSIIGYVDFNSDEGTDIFKIFKCSISPTSGTHDLYFKSTIGRDNPTKIMSFRITDTAYTKPAYVPVDESTYRDNMHDTWVSVDNAGRKIADYEEAGEYNPNKLVGIFYWTWHSSFSYRQPFNNSEFMKLHPEARFDYANPNWPTSDTAYFWNEPLFGYYNGKDYWVLRKQIQMLANAGVDVLIFDCTNGPMAWRAGYESLCKAMYDARKEGLKTPQIAFMSNFGASDATNQFIKGVYLMLYRDNRYSDLWFKWEGKPLMLAYKSALKAATNDVDGQALVNEMKNFFTYREPQPSYTSGPKNNNQWGWLEVYPQHKFGVGLDGITEMVTVGTSVNHSSVTNSITAMNDLNAEGRAYTNAFGQDTTEGAYKNGYFFNEQWKRALEIDPKFIFVTGWNEWTAGRFESWSGISNAFPDQFDDASSRDCEPTKGDMKDNFYYQLADGIRKFKGARPINTATAAKTIDIFGSEDQWSDVGPSFINDKGIYNRNSAGYGSNVYINQTARNNVIVAKVARDSNNLYFYAKTEKNLTAAGSLKWMRLYINTDRNKATGWEGYDFIVNRTQAGVIESNTGDFNWTKAADVQYSVFGDVLQIKIPRSVLGIYDKVDIEFKWVDNTQNDGDIMDFWVNGNAAPLGRFNYLYTEIAQKSLTDEQRAVLSGTSIVGVGSNKAYVNGAKMNVYDADTREKTILYNGAVYLPCEFLSDALSAKVEWDKNTNLLIVRTVGATISTYAGQGTAIKNGAQINLANPVALINGHCYVPISLMSDGFGKTVQKYADNTWAFGTSINESAVLAVANEFFTSSDVDLTNATSLADAQAKLNTFWFAGNFYELSNQQNMAWAAGSGMAFNWPMFSQINAKIQLKDFIFNTEIKVNGQWLGIGVGQSMTKTNIPGDEVQGHFIGEATQGLVFMLKDFTDETSTLWIDIRKASTDKSCSEFAIPIPKDYFVSAYRKVSISDFENVITFSSDGTVYAKIVMDTIVNGAYTAGEVFNGQGVSLGRFTDANMPLSGGRLGIYQRANNAFIKSLKVENYDPTFTLKTKIAQAQACSAENYTAESFAVLLAEIERAQALVLNLTATQQELDNEAVALNNALDALVSISHFVPTLQSFEENFNAALSTQKIDTDWIIPFRTDSYMFSGNGYARLRWSYEKDFNAGDGSVIATKQSFKNCKIETNLNVTGGGLHAAIALRNPNKDKTIATQNGNYTYNTIAEMREGDNLERPGTEGIIIVLRGIGIASDEFMLVLKNGIPAQARTAGQDTILLPQQRVEYKLKYPAGVDISADTNITIYDNDNEVKIFIAGVYVGKIKLSNLVGGIYSSGSVYNAQNVMVGTPFSGMVVEREGHIVFGVRVGSIDIDDIKINETITAGTHINDADFVGRAVSVNLSSTQNINSSKLICAFYSNAGKLIAVKISTISIDEGYTQVGFNLDLSGWSKMKVMLIDDLKSLKAISDDFELVN